MRNAEQPLAGHLFLSDVHLGAFSVDENSTIEQDLITLIKYCTENRLKIIVLGDLFDYWMEYPKQSYVPEHGNVVLNAFEEHLKELGHSLFITGNHDHWTFGHFESRGFEVEHSHKLITLNDQNILLTHGDGTLDGSYNLRLPLLNRILKNKLFVSFFQTVTSPSFGLKTMKWFSQLGKDRTPNGPDALNDWAARCLSENEIDIIITGDDHIPRLETLSSGTYINTGTFFKHRTVALYTNNEFKLVTWDAKQRLFSTYTR